jgi:maltoporin
VGIIRNGITGAICSFLAVTAVAQSIEYHGYFRSGIGGGQWGTDQRPFEVPGAGAKFRLGNETNTYIETGFSLDHSKASESEPSFKSHLKFAYETSGHRDWEGTSANFDDKGVKSADPAHQVALREVWAEGRNLLGPGSSLWAGKRYYMREDLHLLDYYLLDNAGPGAGLEGLDLGPVKLHVAVTRNVPAPEVADLPTQTNLDLRLAGVEVASGTSIMPFVIYGASGKRGSQNSKRFETLNGIHAGAFLRQQLATELNHQFSVQYGTGLFGASAAWGASLLNQWGGYGSNGVAENDTAGKKARDESSSLRVAEQVTLGKSESFSGQMVVVYEAIDFGGGMVDVNGSSTKVPNKTKLMAGVRPQYHLSQNALVAFELGYTAVTNQLTGDGSLGTQEFADLNMTKVTLAPAIAPDLGFWSRPQIRLFATYATWNDEVMNSAVYNDKAGWSVGSQVEAWW